MEILKRLQLWYKQHCDGDWEHLFGVTIDTMADPGWMLSVDLSDTLLEEVDFQTIKIGDIENKNNFWINCSKNDTKFVAMGSPDSLEKLITIFLDWADNNTDTSPWDSLVSHISSKIRLISKEKPTDIIDRLRKIYNEIDDIPTEHPRKRELLNLFDEVWQNQWK